jgi:outer membrane protein assembly complex protein YaeT
MNPLLIPNSSGSNSGDQWSFPLFSPALPCLGASWVIGDLARRVGRALILGLVLACAVAPVSAPASTVRAEGEGPTTTLSAFGGRGPWLLADVRIEGVGAWDGWRIGTSLQTRAAPWWAVWSPDPPFEPSYLQGDLDRIRSDLQSDGYYEAQVRESIVILAQPDRSAGEDPPRPGEVEVVIDVDRGPPVLVCSLYVDLESVALPEDSGAILARDFPMAVGDRFTGAGYAAGAARYAAYLAANGYPEARVDRHARIDVPGRCAEVAYRLEPGPFAVFGPTTIDGVSEALGEIARREIGYVQGRPFDLARLEATQVRLRDTRLFSLVRIDKDPVDEKGEVPIRVELHEGPPHEIRFGVGYGTDDGIRGTASWWNYDFLGGNRRLGFSAKVSRINRWVEASFAQPHFPGPGDLASVAFTLGQQDESTYLDNGFLLAPRIDWKISERLVISAFYAWRYDSLSDVSDATIEDLGPPDEFQNVGFTSSVGLNLRWNNFDDFANPTRGLGIGLTGEVSGGPLGADFDLLRVIAQATYYRPLFGDLILALGARGGSVVPFDRTSQVPLWSRLYAGGNALFPVRGYGRRRVGPLSGSDDPLGGRSVVVGTAELLYPVFGPVQGVVFVDTGDVELSAWTLRPENFQTGVGFGFRASTPVGPVSIDFGFGLDRPAGDSMFHLDLMIGPRF